MSARRKPPRRNATRKARPMADHDAHVAQYRQALESIACSDHEDLTDDEWRIFRSAPRRHLFPWVGP